METNKSDNTVVCEYCNASEQERPIFTTQYKNKKLHVCARCLPNLIHG